MCNSAEAPVFEPYGTPIERLRCYFRIRAAVGEQEAADYGRTSRRYHLGSERALAEPEGEVIVIIPGIVEPNRRLPTALGQGRGPLLLSCPLP